MITRDQINDQLARLAETFKVPKHWGSKDQVSSRFHWAMTQEPAVHPAQLKAAVDAWLKSDESFFPKPGKLRHLALKQQRPRAGVYTSQSEYLDWEFGAQGAMGWGRVDIDGKATFTPCPVCGAEVMYLRGRLKVMHVRKAHDGAGMPTIGWSDTAEAMYFPPKDAPPAEEATAAADVVPELEFTT